MEYIQKSGSPEHGDRENGDYILTNAPGSVLAQRAMESIKSRENMTDLARFDEIWKYLSGKVQTPRRNDEIEFSGFTGHRLVSFVDDSEQYALGFYLRTYRAINTREQQIIIAEWRRVYPEDDRRIEREVREEMFSRIEHKNPKANTHSSLLRLEIFFDKYFKAPSYGDDIEFQVAS